MKQEDLLYLFYVQINCVILNLVTLFSPPKLVNQSANTKRSDHAASIEDGNCDTPHCCERGFIHGLSSAHQSHVSDEVLHFLIINRETDRSK